MASFTTRIELHNGDSSDYETLHTEMEAEGFSRCITSDKGISYQLPTAEYDRSGQLLPAQVLASAKRAAAKTCKKYAAFVTEAKARTWTGLDTCTK